MLVRAGTAEPGRHNLLVSVRGDGYLVGRYVTVAVDEAEAADSPSSPVGLVLLVVLGVMLAVRRHGT